jgi:hypothetical protein
MRCLCSLRTPVSSKASTSRTPTHQTTLDTTPPACFGRLTYKRDCESPFQSSLNLLTNRFLLSLPPISASTIVSHQLQRRLTQTSGTFSTASVNAMCAPSTPQRQLPPRCYQSHYPSRPPFHQRCRARPPLHTSSDPSSTCRRVPPWGRVPRHQRQFYPPPVPAHPISGPLGGYPSARPSQFGPQSIIPGPSWSNSHSRINQRLSLQRSLITDVV